VKHNAALLTNLRWNVVGNSLAQLLGVPRVGLMNDLVANAYGIAALPPEDFFTLNPGEPNAEGNQAIISAGTGLGEAGLAWDGERHTPVSSEGGNADFSPRTELDVELWRHLRQQYPQVLWEYVLCGPATYTIYKFLRDVKRVEEPAWLAQEILADEKAAPVVITRAALEKKSPLCEQTLDLFVTYYGAEAANLALKYMANGGIFIGGGIAPKIITKLRDGSFMRAFIGEGRYRDYLAAIPVRVILNDKTALLGAARYAAMEGALHRES
jgi:glucokinase